MIVAIYVQGISKVLPVNPVSRVERLAPHDRRQERPRQKQAAPSFEAILTSMMQAADPEEPAGFSAYA